MRPETLVEISLAVERFRRHTGTPDAKRRLATYVAEMVDAVRRMQPPEPGDLERVKLAVCFLCSGQVGQGASRCLPAEACPFHLHE